MSSNTEKKAEKSYLASAVGSLSWGATRSVSTPKSPVVDAGPTHKSQQGGDHTIHGRWGITQSNYPEDCPELNTRWFYAVDVPKRKPQLLKSPGPDKLKGSKPPPVPKKFVSFSVQDSKSLETAWQKVLENADDNNEVRSGSREEWEHASKRKYENTSMEESGKAPDNSSNVTVPVQEDYLFDVNLQQRELAPTYWLGPIYEVRRGSWFYQEGSTLRPCEENLANQLEEGYLKVKPFRYPPPPEKAAARSGSVSAKDRVPSSTKSQPGSRDVTPKTSTNDLKGAAASVKEEPAPPPHQPQTYRLFGAYMNSIVTYQDSRVAWLSSDNIMSRVSSTVYQRFAGGAYLSGVKIVRGYEETPVPAKDGKNERPPTPTSAKAESTNNPALQLDERQQRLLKRRSAPPGSRGTEGSDVTTESEDSKKEANTAKADIPSIVPDNPSGEDLRKMQEKEIQDDYNNQDEDQSREIDHLILVSHGIGQKLGMRMESINFIHDVNVFRGNLKSVYAEAADLQALNSEIDKLPKNCRVQVLPILWRHQLNFPQQGLKQNRKEQDLGAEFDDEDYPSLEDLTIEGATFFRNLISDLALDVLLYQSAYREHISRIVLEECNRVYNLFLKRNPKFRGKVSLLGHSLGSAILFDILCRQKEAPLSTVSHRKRIHGDVHHHRRENEHTKELGLVFDVEDFYALGSPIGIFQMLKGRTIAARHLLDAHAHPSQSPLNPDLMDDPFLAPASPTSSHPHSDIPSSSHLPWTVSSPKCAQLYNIFHPSDPISYRIEPLISTAMSSLKPQALPYTKKGIFSTSAASGISGIGAKVGQSVSGLWTSISSGIASSILNRSLGLTSEEVANMGATAASSQSISPGAGTNIGGGVISPPTLSRQDTENKMRKLAENTAVADKQGRAAAETLIDGDMETLFAGFQKRRESESGGKSEEGESKASWNAKEEKARRLRREEMKVRALNRNGRVDYSIQESVLDFNTNDYNPISPVASHLSYWADVDVAHFILSQLLSRNRSPPREGR